MTDAVFNALVNEWDLDEVALRVAEAACRKAGLDSTRWAPAVLARRGWGVPHRTLEAIGNDYGLTRERIRQVAVKAEDALPLAIDVLPEAVAVVAEACDWTAPAASLASLFADGQIDGSTANWTPERYLDLLRACGHEAAAAELARRSQEGRLRRRITPEQRAAIKQARSGLGVLDLRTVLFEGGLAQPDACFQIAEQIYKHAVRVGDWALLGSQKSTALENAAIEQLQVADHLPAHELVRGISRLARNRGWVEPPGSVAIDLLRERGTILETADGGLTLAPGQPAREFVGIELWLLETLNQHDPKAVPADELIRMAESMGIKRNSLSVYMSFSTIVRREQGIIRLVGEDVPPAVAEMLRDAARALRVPGRVDVRANPKGVELVLTLGTTMLNTGVLSNRKQVHELIGGRRHGVRCCPGWTSDSRLGESNVGNAWYGWSPLFQHWTTVHGVEEGQQVRMLMDAEFVSCLEPWAEATPDLSAVANTPTPRPSEHPAVAPAVAPRSVPSQHPATAPGTQKAEPRPGEPWPYPRGQRTLTLSGRFRELLTPQKRLLSTLYGDEAIRLAAAWLVVRPSGGKVWVDRDGNACTLISEELVFLGTVPPRWSW